MSDAPDDFFAPRAFRPAQALVLLKRQLRDLRLTERGTSFEWRGQPAIELDSDDTRIAARLAKRPARSPDWTPHALKNAADVRRFIDAVKSQLRRWEED